MRAISFKNTRWKLKIWMLKKALQYARHVYFSREGRLSPFMFFIMGLLLTPYIRYYIGLQEELKNAESNAAFFWVFLVGTPLMIASICMAVKRLHDFNFKGWWCLLLPAIVYFAPYGRAISYLLLLAIPGHDGANRFGPAPLRLYKIVREARLYWLDKIFAREKISVEEYNIRRQKIIASRLFYFF